ncbi:MAG: chaperone modulator CbpM [Solirubrobacterales bacterium]
MSPGRALVLIDAGAHIRALARSSGLHPELVRRLVVLGAVDPFDRDAAARLARLVRLRRDLGLNVAGAALACDLLARIEELESRSR